MRPVKPWMTQLVNTVATALATGSLAYFGVIAPNQQSQDAVDQCWKTKSPKFRESEIADAEQAYEHARKVYREILERARED